MIRYTRNTLGLAISLAIGVSATPALAQLEEVIVTAQKRAEPLQSTPLSVAAYSEDALEARGISSLADLSVQSPSLQAYDFPTTTSNVSLFIRGFGNTDSQTLTIDNPVGIYIDGVYIARTSGATIDVLDLERVEILRGPQGTLFGRNSSAGAVNFISKRPGDEFAGKLEVGMGEFGAWEAGLTLDVPLTSTLRSKISYDSSATDGWVENKGPNAVPGQPGEDFYQQDQEGYRVALAWDPTDALTVDYSYDHAEVNSTPPYYQTESRDRQEETSHLLLGGAPFKYVLPESDTTLWGHNLTLNWTISDSLALKSITSYREMEEYSIQNWSDTLFFATAVDWSTEALSQEFQLLGDAFDERLEYILGYYYFEEDGEKTEESWTNGVTFALDALAEPLASTSLLLGGNNLGARTFDTNLKSQAVFGQATYTPDILDSRLAVTVGLRYTEDEREASRGVDPGNPSITHFPGENSLDYDHTDYTFVLDYELSADASVYFRTATGYRAGGSGERTLDFSLTFDQEDNVSYELGLKSEWLDHRLRVNAALFTTDYDDLVVLIEGMPPDYASYVENFNAGEARVDGLELDVVGQIGEATTLTFNYTWLDTELSDVVVSENSILLSGPPFSPVDERGQDISDSTYLPLAPDSAYSLSLDHSFMLSGGASLDLNLNYVWRDEVYLTGTTDITAPKLGLLGARLALSDWEVGGMPLTVAVWGRNLTDEDKYVYTLSSLGYQFATPRTYGLDLKLEF